jgi:hypothetical protein
MGRRAVATAFLFVGALFACATDANNAVPDGGADDSAAPDGGSDAPDADSNAPAAESDAPCGPGHYVCERFDDDGLYASRWDAALPTNGASVALTTARAVSPPASLNGVWDAGDAAPASAFIAHELGSQPLSKMAVDLDLLVEALESTSGAGHTFEVHVIDLVGQDASSSVAIYLAPGAAKGSFEGGVSYTISPGVPQSEPFVFKPAPPALGQWVHPHLLVDIDPTSVMSFNATLTSPTSSGNAGNATSGFPRSPTALRVGPYTEDTFHAGSMDVDNVFVDITP